MNIIYILVPLSVLLMILAIGAFFWAVRNDQFEDLDTPALDILDDDERPGGKSAKQGDDVAEHAEDQDPENAKSQSRKAAKNAKKKEKIETTEDTEIHGK